MVKVWAGIGCPDLGLSGVVEVAYVLVAAYSAGVDLVRVTQARAFTLSHKGETAARPWIPDDAVYALGAGDAFVGHLVHRILSSLSLAQPARAAAQYGRTHIRQARSLWRRPSHHVRDTLASAS